MNLWRKTWQALNVEISWEGTVKGTVDASKQVFLLARAIQENKDATEIAPIAGQLSSLLEVLNSPIGQVVAGSLPFVNVGVAIVTFIVEKSQKELSLAESIALVSQTAYLDSVKQFLADRPEIRLREVPASEEVAKSLKTWEEQLGEGAFGEREAKNTLLCFHESPLARVFNAILVRRFQESGLEPELAARVTERISRGTYRYLKEASARVGEKVPALRAIYGEGWQQERETYESIDRYLKEAIASKPQETVFDEGFTFAEIYVRLEVKPVVKRGTREGEVDLAGEAQDMQDWAAKVLLDDSKQGQVMFVQAGPGRGKSVFCRMFADWVRRELHPIWTPILIRLRDIRTFDRNFEETLATAVGWDFAQSDRGWLNDRNTRFLFLLDGFDELLLERGASQDLREFLEQVATFQKRCKENSEKGHRVLVTGRPLALYAIERLMPENLERVGIVLMSDDLQALWLENWAQIINRYPPERDDLPADENIGEYLTAGFRAFLTDEKCPREVRGLAREPLLLYLLASMHRDGKLDVEMFAESRGNVKVKIYESAVDWVLNKQRGKLNLDIADPEDLRSILMEAGLCVVQSGGECASIAAIEQRLEASEDEGAKQILEDARKRDEKAPLRNALAAFYMKAAHGEQNSVEFFHKSFGEFLCAERLVAAMAEWTEKKTSRGKGYVVSQEGLEWQAYDLLGYGHLTPEIVEYVRELWAERGVNVVTLCERLNEVYLRWSDGDFIEGTTETLPQKKARKLQAQGIELGQRQVDIYTGLNALVLLLELHRYGKSREELRDKISFHPCGQPETERFDRERLLRIIGYSECLKVFTFGEAIGEFLASADLSSAHLIRADLRSADLRSADLSSAYLIRADLSSANLNSANLNSVNLSSANLISTNLISTNLIHADLIEANLRSADLSSADLSSADLSSAHLSSADLSSTNLSSAHLSSAHLSSADLSKADLSKADLSNAYLISANLSSAKLIEADLRSAYLISANLRSANLISANLSNAYLISANLISAKLIHTNLRSANLRSANLRSVYLSSANLSFADLSFADLRSANLSFANLSEVKWDRETRWENARNLHEAKGVSDALAAVPTFAATVAVNRGASFARLGEIDRALSAFQEAQQLAPQMAIDPFFWYPLCWYGGLCDRASDALFAAEHLPDDNNYYYYNARGLAKALTGDVGGAIAEFQKAIELSRRISLCDRLSEKRERWLEALQAGENPFTPEELEELRREEGIA